jgi:peptidylprolyl isomerase
MTRALPPLLAALLLTTVGVPAAWPDTPPTAKAIVDAAPPGDWRAVAPENLLVIDFAGGRRVAIELAETFAPVHVANIRTLVRAGFYDGLVIERVQDGYVTQWGDPDGKKPPPPGIVQPAPAEYERPSAGLTFDALPYRDTFADAVGFVGGWPTGMEQGRSWLIHCYGMVGVARDLSPDTGSGSDLYAVIGHSPRQLDRNIALVGRVLSGMEVLTALPRGSGDLGIYEDKSLLVPIVRARLASDMPDAERPHLEVLKTDSATYRTWRRFKTNRHDSFFVRPAGALDVCNALPPARSRP